MRVQPKKRSAIFFGVLLLWISFGLSATATDVDSARMQNLENSLLAPCCYAEPVSRHQSEIAVKMRVEIAKLMEQGKTDEEIREIYINRYGTKVLANITVEPGWSYLVPWLVVMAAVTAAVGLIWKWRAHPPSAPDTARGVPFAR